jgi:hypothetical protein
MDNNLNQAMQYFSPANRNRELYNTSPGDFMRSEDLRQHLEKVMEEIKQADCFDVNPFEIPSLQNHSILSVPQPIDFEKEVLMELCTVNQPMNESLRKCYSKGSFYFLK